MGRMTTTGLSRLFLLAGLCTTGCLKQTLSLDNLSCASTTDCIDGYVCDLADGICVVQTAGDPANPSGDPKLTADDRGDLVTPADGGDDFGDPIPGDQGGDSPAPTIYRKPIAIASGNVAGTVDLPEFPVLIQIENDPDFRSASHGGHVEHDHGYDITFRAQDGSTPLPHELERFDPTQGDLIAWVMVAPALAHNSDTLLYVYYGDPTVAHPTEQPTEVWDSSYQGVWHLEEDGVGAVDEYVDSTRNGNHGRGGAGNADAVPSRVVGQIGHAQNFAARPDYIDCGDDSTLTFARELTLELWINVERHPLANHWPTVVARGSEWDTGWRLYHNTQSPQLHFAYSNVSHEHRWLLSTGDSLQLSTWHHVALIFSVSRSKAQIFVDGVERFSSTDFPQISSSSSPFTLGGDAVDGFAGWLDEVRASSAARTDGWIQTSYANQRAPMAFCTIGSEQQVPRP